MLRSRVYTERERERGRAFVYTDEPTEHISNLRACRDCRVQETAELVKLRKPEKTVPLVLFKKTPNKRPPGCIYLTWIITLSTTSPLNMSPRNAQTARVSPRSHTYRIVALHCAQSSDCTCRQSPRSHRQERCTALRLHVSPRSHTGALHCAQTALTRAPLLERINNIMAPLPKRNTMCIQNSTRQSRSRALSIDLYIRRYSLETYHPTQSKRTLRTLFHSAPS